MGNSEINELIKFRVQSKVAQLSEWKKVRWEGGRLYFEAHTILNEIKDFDIDLKILYLEALYNEKYIIQDNWPLEAPDITQQFRDWLLQTITQLKIDKSQKRNKELKEPNIASKSKKAVFKRIISNPWTITIIGGLILAFLAKLFGLV